MSVWKDPTFVLALIVCAIPALIGAIKMYIKCIKKAEEVVDKELLY